MYPCADGATPLPGIGWRQILRPANFVHVASEAIEAGFSSKLPPVVRLAGYHPNYFLFGFRATPSIPTSKRSSSRSFKEEDGPPQAGLQEPSRASGASKKGLPGPPGLQGQGPRGCQGLPGGLEIPGPSPADCGGDSMYGKRAHYGCIG